MDAGTIIARLMLDESDFNQAIKNTQRLVQKKFKQMEGDVATSVGGMRRQMLKLYQDGKLQSSRLTKTWQTQAKGMQITHRDVTTKMSKNTKKFAAASVAAGKKVEKSWWKTFGAVAVGFTIAYRAMNAIQILLTELIKTFSKGIQAIDDFRTAVIRTAAALSMLSDEPTTEALQAYLAFARDTFEQLELIAARHFATADDLREAFAKFSVMGLVPVGPEQLESMASLVDWILIAEEAVGRTLQIRSEIESVFEGTLRKGAVMARMANQRISDYKEQLKLIEATASSTEKSKMFFEMMAPILGAITGFSAEILKTHMAWRANLDAIFKKIWRAGLNEAYEDLLSIMRKISETLIEHGKLTDTAYKLAYAYNVAWDSLKVTLLTIKDIAVGLYKLWDDMTFHLSPVLHTLKLVAMGVATIKAGFESWVVIIRYTISTLREFIRELALYPIETLQKIATAAYGPILEKHIKVIHDRLIKAGERLERYQEGKLTFWERVLGGEAAEKSIQVQSQLVFDLGEKYNKLVLEQEKARGVWDDLFKAPPLTGMADELQAILDGLTDDLQAIGDWKPGGGYEEWKESLEEGSKILEGLLKFQKELLAMLKSGGKLTDKMAQSQIKAYALLRDIYKDAIDAGEHYATKFMVAESKLLDAKAERIEKELALVVDAKEAELAAELWYHNEVRKLIEGTRQEQIKQFQMQVDWTSSVVDSWTWMYQQLGQKSKRAFEIYKGLQYAQAIIEALSASIKAYSWGWGPWSGPAAPYVATAAMITAWVTAMAKAAMIKGQQYQGYAVGGWLDTHPGGGKIGEGAGGKDDVFLGATPGVRHWAMRDEFVFVMNKEDTKKFEAMREAMNQDWASGGWIDRGYGALSGFVSSVTGIGGGGVPGFGLPIVGPIIEWLQKIWEELSAPPEIPEIPFDPEAFADIQYSIRQMLDDTTALEDAQRGARVQIAGWIKQLEDMNAPLEDIEWVRSQEAIILAHLIAEEEKRIELLNKEFMQDLTLRKLRVLGLNELADVMALMISQEQELADAIEEGASDAVIAFMEEVHAMELAAQEAEILADSISDLESIMSGWENALQSVQDQILSTMTTLSTSPLDAIERLDLLWDAINNFGEVITPEDVSELQGLYSDVLGVAAEAYQRPSIAYGEEYADVLTGLGDLEDIADGILSAYDIQLAQLAVQEALLAVTIEGNAATVAGLQAQVDAFQLLAETPPAWTSAQAPASWESAFAAIIAKYGDLELTAQELYDLVLSQFPAAPYPSYPHGGISVGPESGYPVMLHGIERVTPLGGAGGDASFVMNLTINDSADPHKTGKVVTDAVKTFLKSSQGRMIIQDTAEGR